MPYWHMQNTTPIFPGFHLPTLRRKRLSSQELLADEISKIRRKSFGHLCHVLGSSVPGAVLTKEQAGKNSRSRIYSKENTFWAFMMQILSDDGSCQDVVRKLQSYAALKGNSSPSSSTAAYCKARKRLPVDDLEQILAHSADIDSEANRSDFCQGRRVVVVDGTGLSMPDTKSNQKLWPQQSQQKNGCGFPIMKIAACFSLHTGALLSYRQGDKHTHELPLFREQWDTCTPGDIMLADKGFCNYHDIAMLQDRRVDSVVTMRRKYPISEAKAVKRFSENDLLVCWKRPAHIKTFSKSQWDQLPEELWLRQIRVDVEIKGFRKKSFYIVTTLLNADEYPAQELADLYYKRWDVELFFRDIKTTLGMDILRCKTPDMIRRELIMYLIVYNCLRRIMIEAANKTHVTIRKISFKGTVQAVRAWEPHFCAKNSRNSKSHMLASLHTRIAELRLTNRLGRSEPRVIKRRKKNFQLLSKPRSEVVEIQHRSKYRAKGAKCA